MKLGQSALVVGATSAIGRAIASRLAAAGMNVVLAGRQTDELERSASDLTVRFGIQTAVRHFDALAFDEYPKFFEDCAAEFAGGLSGIVLCHGEMPEQEAAEADPAIARRTIAVNYSSAVSLLELAAAYFENRSSGWICAISSVAGDRGRPSNYIYGSTKGALSIYLQGLRARLAKKQVRVLTVKPGFVDTALTYGRPGLFLVAAPDTIAAAALRGLRRDRAVVYAPAFWALVMWVIRLIPDAVFKRLSL